MLHPRHPLDLLGAELEALRLSVRADLSALDLCNIQPAASRTRSLTVGYDWSKPAFLPAIILNDRPLLAGPARLVLSDAEGQEQLMAVDRFELVESGDLHAVYEIGAAAGHLGRVCATVTAEFDGFAWWDVTFEPHQEVTLGGGRHGARGGLARERPTDARTETCCG